jgi:DNA-directed RNA polymerase subunit RPC12/RpoP
MNTYNNEPMFCPICKKNILSPNASRCKSCAVKLLVKERPEMIKMIKTGKYTLEEIGEVFGVTRERVRQIWKKKTGKPYKNHIEYASRIRKEAEQAKLMEVKFICLSCKKPVLRSVKLKRSYCNDCAEAYSHTTRRNFRIWHTCRGCGIKFHPWSNFASLSQGRGGLYHSIQCYLKSRDYTIRESTYTEEKVIEKLFMFIKENDRVPTHEELLRGRADVSVNTIYKYVHSIPLAVNRALLLYSHSAI